jgi:ComF family protein
MFSKKLIETARSWLLPPACLLCGGKALPLINLCLPCQQELPSLPQHCRRCAQILTSDAHSTCGSCLADPPPFERTYALYPYDPIIAQFIVKLKFQHALSHARVLGEILANHIKTDWYASQSLPDLIIPTPLHSKRLAERGFNQALEIARPLGQRLKIPVDYQGLTRIRHTSAQSGLTAAKRKQNIDGAFSANPSLHGKFIALVDDVVTTGATINACAEALKRRGAWRIHIWCCARA